MKTIGILGFGFMGEAFAVGLRRRNPDQDIVVFDVKPQRMQQASSLNLTAAGSLADLFAKADLTILSIKPQDFLAVAEKIGRAAQGRRVVSIMAARKIQTISEALGTDQVVRLMPSLAAVKGLSPIGLCAHPKASAEFVEDCTGLAAALGTPVPLPERLLSAMTGVSGCAIAFLFHFANALALGGVEAGIDYQTALSIVTQTFEGAASLLRDGHHPSELIDRVCSPGGTTIQGIHALERGAVTAAIMDAVAATVRRSHEIEM